MALINLTQPFTRYSDRVGLDSKPLNRRREMQPVVFPTMQLTLPVAEDIDAGDVVWIDPKSGMYRRFDPTSFDDTEHMLYGVALQAGSPAATQERGITAVRVGMIAGYDLSAYDFGKEIWTSKFAAGRLDDNLERRESSQLHRWARRPPSWRHGRYARWQPRPGQSSLS